MESYEPHPHALLLPALTDEEYGALKADIAEHGILYPVILDETSRILDGVHRVRIAEELGIEPPVSQHEGLSEERKFHLAIGLNMRRRQMDAKRRQELVRRLHDEQALSVRAIASATGWSKSTVARDLNPPIPSDEILPDFLPGATATALVLPDGLSEVEWESIGEKLGWLCAARLADRRLDKMLATAVPDGTPERREA